MKVVLLSFPAEGLFCEVWPTIAMMSSGKFLKRDTFPQTKHSEGLEELDRRTGKERKEFATGVV